MQVRTFVQEQRVCVEVSDTARGIPADDLPYLFERFSRDVKWCNLVAAGRAILIGELGRASITLSLAKTAVCPFKSLSM